MTLRLISILFTFFLLISCSKDEIIYKPSEKIDPFVLYNEGFQLFTKNDYFNAIKNLVRLNLILKMLITLRSQLQCRYFLCTE